MWWPRPRWKSDDLFVYFISLFVIATNAVVMADEGQRCDETNTSAVIWTTALCTALLIMIIIAVYFVYCKRREHDWSSLWWKNNPDKNLVLQTSSPTKVRRQKIGGTDNPSFSVDSNIDDCVTGTTGGLTKIVHVPSSAIADNQLMGIDLSIKEEEDGRRIYTCKHNDGSKDRLVALRLVFDDKGTQRHIGQPSNLSRSLTELIREYGFHVELETESSVNAVEVESKSSNDGEKYSVKSNILSAVRGTAQRLWNQKQLVFKGTENVNDRHQDDVNKEQNCSSFDVETGHVSSAVSVDATDNITRKSPCSVITVVNETVQKSSTGGRQYRTLEYGASPSEMDAQSSPECSIQCGTVIDSLEPVQTVTPVTTEVPATVATGKDASNSNCCVAQVPVHHEGTAVVTVNDGDEKKHDKLNVNENNEPANKHATSNPPPPPPRKYYVSIVPPAPTTVVTTPRAVEATTEMSTVQQITDHSTITAAEHAPPSSPSKNNENPAVVPDDYYWCTTTAMAPPVLSTFGKRLTAETVDDEKENLMRVTNNGEFEKTGTCNGIAAAAEEELHVDGGNNAVTGGVTTTTTSIEDASLPSFSSDEDDDDNVIYADKTSSTVTDNPMVDECNQIIDDTPGKRNGDSKETVVKVTAGQAGYNDITDSRTVTSPVTGAEPKSPTTKLPILRLQSSPPATNNNTTYFGSSSASSSSSSSSPSSPTNHGSNNNSPIVSKIPVRRQSAGSGVGGTTVSSPLTNGTGKKSIPLPLSRSGSRLAMWSTVN